MRRSSTSILGLAYRAIIALFMLWRDLHAQSWGWGHDEQPRTGDEPGHTAPKIKSPPIVSST